MPQRDQSVLTRFADLFAGHPNLPGESRPQHLERLHLLAKASDLPGGLSVITRRWYNWRKHGDPVVEKVKPKEPETQKPLTTSQRFDADRKVRELQLRNNDLEAKYRHAMNHVETLERDYATALGMQPGDRPSLFHHDQYVVDSTRHSALHCLLWSDLHVEEMVDPATVFNQNEYNPDIATKRFATMVDNTIGLMRQTAGQAEAKTAFLWLGGDFITNYLHDENQESNWLGPMEAGMLAQNLLESGINRLLEHGGIKKLIVATNWGNHGRLYKKKRISTGHKSNLDWLICKQLSQRFVNVPEVEFNVGLSNVVYTTINGYTFRTIHGDNIGYQGGIGGVTIPLAKWLMRQDQNKEADWNFLGHFHSYGLPVARTTMNGSLIGYGPYAEWLGATAQPPTQGYQVLDFDRRRMVQFNPVACE